MTEAGQVQLHEQVRERYARAAITVLDSGGAAACGSGSGSGCCEPAAVEVDDRLGSALYASTDREGLPVAAVAATLGCRNPIAVADLRAGKRVLDLGSDGGIDVLPSARRVGPTRFAYGVDMTDEMLALAAANVGRGDERPVPQGTLEDVPLRSARWTSSPPTA